MENYLILLPILLSLVATIVIFIAGRIREELGSFLTTLITGIIFLIISLIYIFYHGDILQLKIDVGLPFTLFFLADPLGIFLAFVTSLLWFMASFYSIKYISIKHEATQFSATQFNVFLLLTLYGMLGVVLTGNLFSLLIFFEVFSVASTILVIHEGTPEAVRAGWRYLFMSIVGSVAIIAATAILYGVVGSIDFSQVDLSTLKANPSLLFFIFWLLIVGFGVKAGMFPVHVWLPEAHPIAPSSASALLSGVMIKAGAYGIIRTVYGIFGQELANAPALSRALLVVAIITMIWGSILAITRTELKRLLAYSSVAQIGYIILGIALLSPKGLLGGVIHIFNHALMKGALFLCAGAIITQTGLRNLKDLRGIGRRMPLTMAAFTLAALSIIGVPPFIGFYSKWFLALGALQPQATQAIGQWGGVAIISALLLSSLLNVVYYGPILISGWFYPPPEIEGKFNPHQDIVKRVDPSWIMMLPILILASGTLIFGFSYRWLIDMVEPIVRIYF